MNTLRLLNYIVSVIFILCYVYQFCYIPISLLKKKKPIRREIRPHSFAVLICARNEETVIGDLLDSIHRQSYDQSLLSVFVLADNCTDRTAEIARQKGAKVYTRVDREHIGKGYALQALRRHINEDHPYGFDGYFVFDADNILTPNYIEEMNKTFCEGHDVVTGYRNSKNYGDNWISAGYALWFLRESRYLNQPRSVLGFSSLVSGTGFLFSRKVADEIVDWPFHMLTEDIEFSANRIANGHVIAYCPTAELFDEQPTRFSQSWNQRLRWAQGYLQVFRGYGVKLLKGMFSGNFSCFDMSMAIMPAFILSMFSIICNLVLGVWGALAGDNVMIAVTSLGEMICNVYLTLFVIGTITTVSEWRRIRTTAPRKILFLFTFPLFLYTYIPIGFAAFFCKREWKPIRHTVSARQMEQQKLKID